MTPTTTVVRVTATGTSSRLRHAIVAALVLASTAALAACGAQAPAATSEAPAATGQPYAFAWLHPSPPPPSWQTSRLPGSPAQLAYPAGWRSIVSDPGTRTAAIRTSSGRIEGYLNATPRQGAETLANWSTFRLDHNAEEGDTHNKLIASAANLRFLGANGSCVIDDYTSSSGHRYREIACIVAGASATTVVVGAAPPQDWQREAPVLERAISSFQT
jgi:hypothetical protein